MSATATLIDFPAKARELASTIEALQGNLNRVLALSAEIAAAAAADDNGGLPRLGFAIHGEAESLAGYLRDQIGEDGGLDFEAWAKDARDLVAVIDLALDNEAVPS
jgi:hypothetical protein